MTRACFLLFAAALAAGCRPPAPVAPAPATTPEAEPEPEPPAESNTEHSAFVVLYGDMTVVIPVGPQLEEFELPGHWVALASDAAPRARGRYEVMVSVVPEPDQYQIPICVDGDFDDPCTFDLEPGELTYAELPGSSATWEARVDIEANRVRAWTLHEPWLDGTCSCVVVPGISTDGTPEPEFDLSDPDTLDEIEMSPYEPEEYEDECGEEAMRPDVGPYSYVGGVRYDNGMAHSNVCNGLNLYDGVSEPVELRPGSSEPADFVEGPVACEEGEIDMAPELAPMGDDYEDEEDDEDYDEDDICDEEYADETLGWSIHRGHLIYGRGHIYPAGGECVCASAQPLKTATCPSEFDPCGTDEGFGGLEEYDDWWVSSDGAAALVVDEEQLRVLDAEGDETRTASAAPDGLLGVEFHPETALSDALEVPLEIEVVLPSLAADDLAFDGSAKQWGNRCFTHLKGERLDAAEAACWAGLAAGGSDRTRGAITYSLGRVEEKRGRLERARGYYQRSLRLRPGNATVEGRLQALPAQ